MSPKAFLRCAVFAVVALAMVLGVPTGQRMPVDRQVAGLDAVLVATLDGLIGPSAALAQTAKKKERRGLFSILFGRKTAKKKAVKTKTSKRRKKTSKKSRSRKKRSSTASGVSKPTVPAVVAVAKSEEARKVLVIGDFFSGALADGLTNAYAQQADIVVVDKSNGLSGLVRSDVVDWAARLPELVEAEKPAYVVAMLGANDRQLIREDGEKLKKRTPGWDAAYIKRVGRLGDALRATGLPYTWVGLPPVRFKNMNGDFLYFNEQYAKAAASAEGTFVDVWDGFADADGNYSRSGPDVNGQIVLLRPKDGINLTKAGRRRLAFYIQAQVQKAVLGGGLLINPGLGFDIESDLPRSAQYDPERTGRTVVIRLDDPTVDGSETLAGETVKFEGGVGGGFSIPHTKLTKPTQKTGRVDDYNWPPRRDVPAENSSVTISQQAPSVPQPGISRQ